ncbi:MAG: DUF1269 domain-containing protein [Rhodobacterales bacterium]|nr:DUF1269 domain-containing protein [Rhodobacterales bacterium]
MPRDAGLSGIAKVGDTIMAGLIVGAFDDEATAFEMRAALVKMQGDYLLKMEDVVVVTKSADGKVALHQAVNMTATGAVGGGMWGALVGLLFLNPLLGAAVGAGAGALSGRFTDIGINDDKMKDIGASLTDGGAAVCVLVRQMTGDKVLAGLSDFHAKGRVVQTSLSDEQEAALRAAIEKPAASA